MRFTGLFLVLAAAGLPLRAQDLEACLKRLSLLAESLEQEPLSVTKCAFILEPGLEGALRFVREHIRRVPYEGVLKGSRGVLISGEANSLEKAILLARILKERGYPVRVCRTDPSKAIPSDRRNRRTGADPSPEKLRSLAERLGFPAEVILKFARRRKARARALLEFLAQRTESTKRMLSAHFPPSKPRAAKESSAFVVQVAVSPEKWVTLDPTFGRKPAEGGLKLKEAYRIEEVEAEYAAQLLIQVFVATKTGRQELVSFKSDFASVAMKPITVGFIPLDFVPKGDPLQDWKAYRKTERFVCGLTSGGKSTVGNSFDLKGTVYRSTGDGRIEAAGRLGRGLGSLFGGARGEGPQKWSIVLEGRLKTPAGEKIFVRPLVEPQADPDSIRVSLLSSFTYLLIPGPVQQNYFTLQALRYLLENEDILRSFPAAEPLALLKELPPVCPELTRFASALRPVRDRFIPKAAFPYLLVGYERRFAGKGTAEVNVTEGYDIVACPVSVLEPEERAGLTWGAALTELERLLLELDSAGDVLSASALFLRAQAEGLRLRLLRKEEDLSGLPEAHVPPIKEELKHGRFVLVPEAPLKWHGKEYLPAYVFDPASGVCVGRIARRGQAMTEYLEKLDMVMSFVGAIDSFSKLMRCMTAAIISPLAGKERAQARREFLQCFTEWAMGKLFSGIKGLFKIDPTAENIAADALVGGIPGTPFGGFTGLVSKGVAKELFGK